MLDYIIVVPLFYKALQISLKIKTSEENKMYRRKIDLKHRNVDLNNSGIGGAELLGLAIIIIIAAVIFGRSFWEHKADERPIITVEKGQSPAEFFGPIMAGTSNVKKIFGNSINQEFEHIYEADNPGRFSSINYRKKYEADHPMDRIYIGKNLPGLNAAEMGLVIFTNSPISDKNF